MFSSSIVVTMPLSKILLVSQTSKLLVQIVCRINFYCTVIFTSNKFDVYSKNVKAGLNFKYQINGSEPYLSHVLDADFVTCNCQELISRQYSHENYPSLKTATSVIVFIY